MDERREEERVQPIDDCIVVHSKRVGNIKNISQGGLFCICFQDPDCQKDMHREVDILCGQGKHLVQGVKVKVVETEKIAGKFLANFEMQKCRLQFTEIEEHQAFGIETILSGSCLQ